MSLVRATSKSTVSSFLSRSIVGAALTVLPAFQASLGAQSAPPRDPSPHSDAVLISDAASVQPGGKVTVAVRLTLDTGWHTYWSNPGDAGLPLEVKWTLPAGVTAGPLQFPTPRLTPQPPLMSYGYENEVLVLTELTVPANITVGSSLAIAGRAEWLACAEICLPASGPLSLSLPVNGATGGATKWASAVAATRAQLPDEVSPWQTRSWATPTGYVIQLVPNATAAVALTRPYLFVDSASIIEYPLPQRMARAGDTVVIALTRAALSPKAAVLLTGIITPDVSARDPRSWRVSSPVSSRVSSPVNADIPRTVRARAETLLASASAVDIGGVGTAIAGGSIGTVALPDPGADMTLIAAIVFAFIGGLLLNLMPCVFPVLSVEVLALLEHGGMDDPSRGRKHGLAFGAGVVLSFWILAGVLMALRAGGESLGWGFQLQSPAVVALLALLMFALGLNLSGVFEIGLTLTRLGAAGSGRGYGDSLLTGGLAVLVAAPCTAPFMGAALGFALVQPALIGLMVFTALGAGLALPFVVLASAPKLLRFLPRPGPWLETLKQFFAFPLYATVVWLLWVLGQQAGIDALAIVLLAMIALALGAWLWARGVRSDRGTTRAAAAAVMLGAVLAATMAAVRAEPPTAVAVSAPGWEPYSAARVSELRQEGRPIFIDFTAAWCLSCQVNERVVLRTDAVQRAFSNANVALLKADWTSRDSAITNVLAGFGRSGVPLYVLYPAGSGAATILPAVLTPGMVVSAVQKAAPTTVVLDRVR